MGQSLKGVWQVSRKIDGVRALKHPTLGYISRNGKPLYNLEGCEGDDVEIFHNSWNDTISLVRTKDGEPVPQEYVYSLDPLDPRLDLGAIPNPDALDVNRMLEAALARGDEGLVLRQGRVWLKVKPQETYDVEVTGIKPGKGKYKGKIGSLITPMGCVSGMTDEERETLRDSIGQIIEVECMELTKNGKFRHPRFKRLRFDKSQE